MDKKNRKHKKLPLVSIILPTYNRSHLLPRAIISVLGQTFQDFELIIIDDGSTDETEKVVKAISDNRIVYFKNPKNLGIQKSLNRGLKVAKGKYIARIDDDDEWCDQDKLKKQVDFLNNHPDYVLVGTGIIIVDENKKELLRFLYPETDKKIRQRLLSGRCFNHSNILFRKETTLKIGGYSEKKNVLHVEDHDLWLKLGKKGKLANLPIYAVKFRRSKDSICGKYEIDQLKKYIQLAKKNRYYYPNSWRALLRLYVLLFIKKYCPFLLPIMIWSKKKILNFWKRILKSK